MMDDKIINEGKSLAWLSYLGILLLIPLLVNRENEYSKFHVKQGIVLLACSIMSSFGMAVISLIPYLGALVVLGLSLFLFILTIIGIVNSLKGKTEPLPVIGQFAEKIRI